MFDDGSGYRERCAVLSCTSGAQNLIVGLGAAQLPAGVGDRIATRMRRASASTSRSRPSWPGTGSWIARATGHT